MSIYFAVARVVWAFIIVLGLLGFLYRVSKPITRFTNIRIFEVLGRLTYGAYVGHFFIIKIMFYNVRELSNLNVFNIVSIVVLSLLHFYNHIISSQATKIHGTMYLAYFLSLALALLVELPISAIQKQILEGVLKSKRPDQNKTEEVPNGIAKDIFNGGFTNDAFKRTFRGSVE